VATAGVVVEVPLPEVLVPEPADAEPSGTLGLPPPPQAATSSALASAQAPHFIRSGFVILLPTPVVTDTGARVTARRCGR
jgi:hypothetical protein